MFRDRGAVLNLSGLKLTNLPEGLISLLQDTVTAVYASGNCFKDHELTSLMEQIATRAMGENAPKCHYTFSQPDKLDQTKTTPFTSIQLMEIADRLKDVTDKVSVAVESGFSLIDKYEPKPLIKDYGSNSFIPIYSPHRLLPDAASPKELTAADKALFFKVVGEYENSPSIWSVNPSTEIKLNDGFSGQPIRNPDEMVCYKKDNTIYLFNVPEFATRYAGDMAFGNTVPPPDSFTSNAQVIKLMRSGVSNLPPTDGESTAL